MDPDVNYAEQARLLGSTDPSSKERRKDLARALRAWIQGGGYKPKGFHGFQLSHPLPGV